MVLPVQSSFYGSYTPVGDLVTIAVCFVILILLFCSFIKRTRSFRIFLMIVGLLLVSAYANVTYNTLLERWDPSLYFWVSALRVLFHGALFAIFFLFTQYIAEVTSLERRAALWVTFIAGVLFVAVVALDIIDSLNHTFGFRIDPDGTVHTGMNIFYVGYFAFVILIAALLVRVRNYLFSRVMFGFFCTIVLAIGLNLLQLLVKQSSFTVSSFMLPVFAMLYIMHSNPYNAKLGTVDISALEDMVRFEYSHKRPFGFLSLYLPAFAEEHAEMPSAIQSAVRKFSSSFFRGAVVFSVGPGHMLLIYDKQRNPNYEERISMILEAFHAQHARFRNDYKIVIGDSVDRISARNDYVHLIRTVLRDMKENTIHRIEEKDFAAYNRQEYILKELVDIYHHRNLNDSRVLVYCQPVYNIALRRYDTAEALMRLDLPETGIIFPDEFIPLAEKNGYIHVLTEIILNKTCREARRLAEEGYSFSRISVNVSAQELKGTYFCRDISQIIRNADLPGDRVALELTESQDESDFLVMEEKIRELKSMGITFYLDDFGTGYSSLERIMQLPFDIIKFDRSLVVASGASDKSEQIVRNMARLFAEMDFSVLYEGVETEKDEKRCVGMSASYLQGYKYSRPVPISGLRDFFTRAA